MPSPCRRPIAECIAELAAAGRSRACDGTPKRACRRRSALTAAACWLSAPVRQAAASSRVYRELPLCVAMQPERRPAALRTRRPSLLEGFCDLLYRAPEGWVVVDYKTDRRVDDQSVRRQYELQAGAYALAVERITGERVSRACFVLAGAAQPGQPAPVLEFPVTEELLARVRARIAEAVSEDVPVAD